MIYDVFKVILLLVCTIIIWFLKKTFLIADKNVNKNTRNSVTSLPVNTNCLVLRSAQKQMFHSTFVFKDYFSLGLKVDERFMYFSEPPLEDKFSYV